MFPLLYYCSLVALLAASVAGDKFNMCCTIKTFNIEPCMIKDGRVIEYFSSKDKVAEFPIMNSTELMQCKMTSDVSASYYMDFSSTSLSNMDDPGIDPYLPRGLVDNETTVFTVNFTCNQAQKTFVKVEVQLTYLDDDSNEHFIFYLAKNCSLPTPIVITNNKNAMILYVVCGVLALILVLVIVISVVCYIRIRRRSQNQKVIEGVGMTGRHTNGYAPLPSDTGYPASSYPPPSVASGQQYNPYTGQPNHSLPSLPSLHSSIPHKPHHAYGYSSGEGSFMSEPLHSKMAGGGLLPPAYPNGNNTNTPNDLKIQRSSVVFDTFLKSGTIGITYLATYTRDASLNQHSTVFAKTLKDEACTRETVSAFLREAVILELVTHPNILSVTGIVHEEGGMKPPIAIYPYMKGGNMHNLLHLARPTPNNPNTLTLADQIHMMICVARGMEALSRNNVHGDLAARNCVVGNDLVVKIADSALSRDLFPNDYHELPNRIGSPRLPLKWMAIECLTDLMYSTMSDVWAFGVTFWEVLTFGEVPYIDVQPGDMVKHLQGGWRLMQPESCTDELFSLLVRCWAINPEDRMSFSNILAQLEALQCKGAMGLYRPSALEQILKQRPTNEISPCTTPLSDSDQIQV